MTLSNQLEMTWQDFRYALRSLRKKPGFTAVAILILALAIGGNTAIFTVIHAVLLSPLPYPAADRLVRISGGATPSRFTEMKAAAHSFTAIAAFTGNENPTLSGNGEPQVLKGVRVSADFLQILGIHPLFGRSFRAQEDSPGGPLVVMLSASLWRRRFAGNPNILGKTATLGGTAYIIIGVLPPAFSFPSPDLDVWMTAPSEWPVMSAKSRALSPFLTLFGRLKPNVPLAAANAEAKVIQRQYSAAHPAMLDAKLRKPETVIAMKDNLVADVRFILWMLLGAVGFVLLVACGNVAGLLLARASARSREIALRAALGAGRLRLMSQLVAESVVLSVASGLLGLLLAAWSLHVIRKITAFDLPRTQEIHMDGSVLGFALALSITTGLLFGLAPALAASRPDLIQMLRSSGIAASQITSKRPFASLNLRAFLLVAQVSLSLVLLIGAALLLESVSRLRGVSLGFAPANVLTVSLSLPPSRYESNHQQALFFEQLTERLSASPGVRSAAAAMFLPMMNYAGVPVQDAAKPVLKLNQRPIMTFSVITPGYFRTLGIPLRRGRVFTARDKENTQRVAIIDEALARRFWPAYPRGLDPVGQRLWVGGINPHPAEIVGIAANIHQMLENSAWPETVYVAFAQSPQPFATVAVRAYANPLALTGTVREQVQRLDKDQALSAVQTMNHLIDEQVGPRQLLTTLLGSFAAMALLLVLTGIYGSVAYSVAQRTQEVAVRCALGAQPADILRLVVGQSIRLALAGVVIGLAGAFALTRLMQDLFFHISPTDPVTFLTVVSLFLAVTLAASYIPARRATRIDPATALRT